jgi:hypothetical protein
MTLNHWVPDSSHGGLNYLILCDYLVGAIVRGLLSPRKAMSAVCQQKRPASILAAPEVGSPRTGISARTARAGQPGGLGLGGRS